MARPAKDEGHRCGIEKLKKALPQCKIEWNAIVIEPKKCRRFDKNRRKWIESV